MNWDTIKIVIKNNHGLGLATEIYRPKRDGPLPTVIIFHGFTGYKEENNLVDIAERLATIGIVSVRFTASGFGDSQGSLKGDYRFSNYIDDAGSVYDWLTKQAYVDREQMGVCGHSMGGKLAVLFAVTHPTLRALCIVSAPAHFFSTSYGNMENNWKQNGYFEKVSGRDGKTIRVPYAYVIDEKPHDTIMAARGVASSLRALVVAGEIDNVVKWQDTKMVFDALACTKRFLLLGGIDHFYKRKPDLLPVVHKPIADFFEGVLV